MRNDHDETGFNQGSPGHHLGSGGVESVVKKVEAFCEYEQLRIELSNQPRMVALQAEADFLNKRKTELEEHLAQAPPMGDVKANRRRAIICWIVAALLTMSGFAFCVLAFDPFGLGWKAYLYCLGIAVLTPFCVEKLLTEWKSERLIKTLVAVSCVAALGSLVTLAAIRGDIFAHQFKTEDPALMVEGEQPSSTTAEDTFYEDTVPWLRLVMVFLAIAGELAAGLAFHDALRLSVNHAQDFARLYQELEEIKAQLVLRLQEMAYLRNEAAVFAAQFWRDFYQSMIVNTVRSAITKLLFATLVLLPLTGGPCVAQERKLAVVVAVDLTASLAQESSDKNTPFQKNLDAVSRLLMGLPSDTRITVVGITDQSFTQPLILLSAHISPDEGYFGERLASARRALLKAWNARSSNLIPQFQKTDVLGALLLAGQLLEESSHSRKLLVILSDMRHVALGLDLETPEAIDAVRTMRAVENGGLVANLQDIEVYIAGAVAAGKRPSYWQGLRSFWAEYFRKAGATMSRFAVTWDLPRFSRAVN